MTTQIAEANKEKVKQFLLKEGSLSKNAIAAVMGNINDECGFMPRTENLNYTTVANLRRVWPTTSAPCGCCLTWMTLKPA